MSVAENPRAVVGDNSEDLTPYELTVARVADLVTAANAWLEQVPQITNEETAKACDSYLTQVKAELKASDEERKLANKPLDDEIKATNKSYKTVTEKLDAIINLLTPKKTAWLKAEQDRIAAERRAAEAEALRKIEEAEALAAQAPATVEEAVAAETAIKEATEALKLSDRLAALKPTVKGDLAARSSGLRTYYSAKIVDAGKALAHYANNPTILEALQTVANADARALKDELKVPGVEVQSEQRAV